MRQITMRFSSRRTRPGAPHVRPAARWLASLGLAAGSAVAVAACGSAAGPGGPASPGHAAARVSLIVEVTPRPGAKATRWTLQCEPAGGTHPDAAAACHQLLTAKRPFAPIARGVMCPMIVTGEQTATIRGSWFGAQVDATFSQLSGCAAMRWRELGQVFNPIVH
jgi:Subtilisin inhibitor-like